MGYNDFEETIKRYQNKRELMEIIKASGTEVLLDISLAISTVRKQIQEVPNGYETFACASAIERLATAYQQIMEMLED